MVIFTFEHERHSPEPIVFTAFRIDVRNLAEIGEAHTVIAFSRVAVGANYVSRNRSRINLDRPARIGDRTSKISFAYAGEGAIVVGSDVLWIDGDRPARLGDRLVVIACIHVKSATCHVSIGEFWTDLGCVAFIRKGSLVVPPPPICSSATRVSGRAIVCAKRVRLDEACAGGNSRLV